MIRTFSTSSIQPLRIDGKSINVPVTQVYGNDSLQALVLPENGTAVFVDAKSEIKLYKLEPAAVFRAGMLAKSGICFLIDDRKILYRWNPGREVTKSRPLKIDGEVIAIAVEESSRVLWCAMSRKDSNEVPMTVYGISLENGKVIGSANLESRSKSCRFYASANGNGTIMAASDSPGAFFFKRDHQTVLTKYLKAEDLVKAAVFDGANVLIGLRTGLVNRIDTATGAVTKSYITDSVPVTALSLQDKHLFVGHGIGSRDVGSGSSYIVDTESGLIDSKCGTKEQVTAVAGDSQSISLFLGMGTGNIQILDRKGNVSSIMGDPARIPGTIRWLATQWPICMVIGDREIQRIEFRK